MGADVIADTEEEGSVGEIVVEPATAENNSWWEEDEDEGDGMIADDSMMMLLQTEQFDGQRMDGVASMNTWKLDDRPSSSCSFSFSFLFLWQEKSQRLLFRHKRRHTT